MPMEVKMPIHFFEKSKCLTQDVNMKAKITVAGDILNYFKTSKATVEQLCKENGQAVINEGAKKSIKL